MDQQEQELFQCDWCGKQYPHVKDHNGLCARQPADEGKTRKLRAGRRSEVSVSSSGVYMSSACRNRHHPNCKDEACTCKHHLPFRLLQTAGEESRANGTDQLTSAQINKEIKAARIINQGEGYMSTACRNRHHPRCKNETCTCKHHNAT